MELVRAGQIARGGVVAGVGNALFQEAGRYAARQVAHAAGQAVREGVDAVGDLVRTGAQGAKRTIRDYFRGSKRARTGSARVSTPSFSPKLMNGRARVGFMPRGAVRGRRFRRGAGRVRRFGRRYGGRRPIRRYRRTRFARRRSYRAARDATWSPPFIEKRSRPRQVTSLAGQQGVTSYAFLDVVDLQGMRTYLQNYMPVNASNQPLTENTEKKIHIAPEKHFLTITSQSPAAQQLTVEVYKCRRASDVNPVSTYNQAMASENDFEHGTIGVDMSAVALHASPSTAPRVRQRWSRVWHKTFFMNHGQVVKTAFTVRPRAYYADAYLVPSLSSPAIYQPGFSYYIVYRANGTPMHDETDPTTVSTNACHFDILDEYTRITKLKYITNSSWAYTQSMGTVATPKVMNEYGPAVDVSAS